MLYTFFECFKEWVLPILPLFVILFGLYKYIKHIQYIKKKDTYEYIDNIFQGELFPIVENMNKRMNYFDYYFHLSLEEQIEHKNDVQKVSLIFSTLLHKLQNDLLDKEIMKLHFNNSMKKSLVNLSLHYDITFSSYSIEVEEVYKLFYEDVKAFEEKILEQRKFFIDYFDKNVKDKIKIKINEEEKTLTEWIKYTNLSKGNCEKKDEFLHILQSLQKLYESAGLYLSLGNLYFLCLGDPIRALKCLERAVNIDSNLTQAYVSLIEVTHRVYNDKEKIFKVINSIPKEIRQKDEILFQEAVKYGCFNEIEKVQEIANKISNIDLKRKLENLI